MPNLGTPLRPPEEGKNAHDKPSTLDKIRTVLDGLDVYNGNGYPMPDGSIEDDEDTYNQSFCLLDEESISINPAISITDRALQDMTADALDALDAVNNPPHLFTRSGELVRVTYDKHAETYRLRLVTESALIGEMARSAIYTKERRNQTIDASPPLRVAKDILSLPDLPFLPIAGLVETPIIRPDGSIFSLGGYDPHTRLYLTQEFYLKGPEAPTQEDAKTAAACVIDEVLHDFPFVDNASKANTMGAMLTVLMRPAIQGNVPMALFDKPAPGTGASLLVDLIAMVSTGKTAAVTTAPSTEDEWRKRLVSMLWKGSALILIDNVTGVLKSDSLSSLLTARTVDDRRLGTNEMLSVPNNATVMVTGNNLALGGDLPRRSYWIRQDAKMAMPWQREGWHHKDIAPWVSGHRGEILAALCTMIKAWFTAGCPASNTKKIGSYENWCEKIGGILAYAGIDDFLGNLDEMYDRMDEENTAWNEFLLALLAEFPTGFTTRDLIDRLTATETLLDIVPEEIGEVYATGKSVTRRIGHKLKAHIDRLYPCGLKLTSTIDKHSHVNTWRVEDNKGKYTYGGLRV